MEIERALSRAPIGYAHVSQATPEGVIFPCEPTGTNDTRWLKDMLEPGYAVDTADLPADAGDDSPGPDTAVSVDEVIDWLQDALHQPSVDWHAAVLEAIGRWPVASEVVDGEQYDYLLAGEAFDWKLLAQRIKTHLPKSIPEHEWGSWISSPVPFGGLEETEFTRILGVEKHRAHLSYFYGVTVEQALLTAVGEEIAKGRVAGGRAPNQESRDDSYLRLYGSSQKVLWYDFITSKEADQPEEATALGKKASLNVMDDFMYWLFKKRMGRADPARVASDTRKGLAQLERMRQADGRRTRMRRLAD